MRQEIKEIVSFVHLDYFLLHKKIKLDKTSLMHSLISVAVNGVIVSTRKRLVVGFSFCEIWIYIKNVNMKYDKNQSESKNSLFMARKKAALRDERLFFLSSYVVIDCALSRLFYLFYHCTCDLLTDVL